MTPKNLLTLKQHRFVKNYAETLDAVKAATEAGYSTTRIKTKAAELLKNPVILDEIHATIENSALTLKISDAYIVKKLLQIINSTTEEPQTSARSEYSPTNTKFKDASIALRAVDILAKVMERQKADNKPSTGENNARVICIENLNEDKI